MSYNDTGEKNFFSEMAEHQISAREFFCAVLLDSLERNFGVKDTVITYFDTHGRFLSWITRQGIQMNCKEHPYGLFLANDIVRHIVYEEAVRDELTYFNVDPRLYKSTDIISPVDYDHSAYVRFLEENFQAHYSVTMAFGINAYIQITVFKGHEKGDFTVQEMEILKDIYIYVANAYKNFKKYEQAKIVANIQNEIIASGEKAYLVTDDFMHIMSYNNTAMKYLKDILGDTISGEISTTKPCSWLPFLLGDTKECTDVNSVQKRIIKNYVFKIYTYDQTYSNGIIDRYHWITISSKSVEKDQLPGVGENTVLTQTEQRVAELLYAGLTYKAIAEELTVSYHTVKKHVQNIYMKCGVNSRFELYKWLENVE